MNLRLNRSLSTAVVLTFAVFAAGCGNEEAADRHGFFEDFTWDANGCTETVNSNGSTVSGVDGSYQWTGNDGRGYVRTADVDGCRTTYYSEKTYNEQEQTACDDGSGSGRDSDGRTWERAVRGDDGCRTKTYSDGAFNTDCDDGRYVSRYADGSGYTRSAEDDAGCDTHTYFDDMDDQSSPSRWSRSCDDGSGSGLDNDGRTWERTVRGDDGCRTRTYSDGAFNTDCDDGRYASWYADGSGYTRSAEDDAGCDTDTYFDDMDDQSSPSRWSRSCDDGSASGLDNDGRTWERTPRGEDRKSVV